MEFRLNDTPEINKMLAKIKAMNKQKDSKSHSDDDSERYFCSECEELLDECVCDENDDDCECEHCGGNILKMSEICMSCIHFQVCALKVPYSHLTMMIEDGNKNGFLIGDTPMCAHYLSGSKS